MSKQNPLVLIITLNYNQDEFTIKCVEAILNSNYPEFKIYVWLFHDLVYSAEPANVFC